MSMEGYRGYATDELVTGEGVALELPVASVGLRIASGAIDVITNLVVLIVLLFAREALTGRQSEAVQNTGVIVAMVAALVGIPVAWESLGRGRTLGKLALGLRVVRDDGGPVAFRHALTRALVGWVEVYLLFGAPALVSAMVSARGKRLGDLAAGTYVTAERTRLFVPPPPMVPRELAAWAGSADVGALPPGLSVALRQYLGRAHTLPPASRYTLATDLLERTLPHVSPAPPAGHHPEVALAAVLAERHRRDLARLHREQLLRESIMPSDRL